jgi:hypothetical protein
MFADVEFGPAERFLDRPWKKSPISADDFCRLILSRRLLKRANDRPSGELGLFDPSEGVCYVLDDAEYSDYLQRTLISDR